MIYRVVLDDLYDLHTSDINCMLLNPSLELEMNSAGSFNFTLPPTHPYWDSIEILKSTIDVYEDDDLIFTGRVANIDKNWNNERVVECEGALAYFNDSIHRQMKWENPLPIAVDPENQPEDPSEHIQNFLEDILNNHNVFVGDAVNRQIHMGHIYVDPYLVTREVDYDTTLDILTRMCIDTNGGYFMIRKDPETHLLYLDWLKDFTEESGQPASFGVNLLDFNTGLHAADICTGVLARGATVNDQVVTLSNVELVDETTYPDMSVDHYTDHDQDILWHREGMAKFGRVVQVHEFPDAQTDWKNGEQVVANSLFEEARKWLEEKNTKVESIEVEVAELSWLREGVPKYKLGQIVEILDDAHMAGESYEVRRLPMYKLSCDLSSGSKKVTLGRPPKKELTQISASNSDSSTLSSGNSSGSSSGGGSGSGEECKVHDVRVDGTSVVSDKIANISLTGKADVSTVNALAAAVATKADASTVTALADVVSGKQDQIEFNTQEAATEVLTRLKANDIVYNLGGGTEVEANPSESATDDLNTIKIGDTVYDIPGGGSNTNYGKFKCELIFNTATRSTGWSDTVTVCTKDVLDEYDAIYVTDGMLTNGAIRQETKFVLVKDIESIGDNGYQYMFGTDPNGTSFFVFGLRVYNNNLIWYSDRNGGYLFKVYGLKFENKLINRSDIYSEEERMIGRWTDGKPLYQKTIITTNTTINNWVRVDVSSLNIDNICDLYGQFTRYINNKNYWYEFTGAENLYNSNYVGVLRFDFENGDGELTYRINFEATNKQIFTLQYTKTTDSADSGVIPEDPMFISDPMIFSEEEHVVGSWTDGKPLYQKCFTGTVSTRTSDWVEFGTVSNDVDAVIHLKSCFRYSSGDAIEERYITARYASGKVYYYCENIGNITGTGVIVIQYTKTTDSPLSGPKKGKIVQRSDIYSEEERMIGRWTDGKPIYQKTWFNVANGTDLVTNVDTLVDYRVKKRGTSGSEDYEDIGDGFRLEDSSVVKVTNNIASFYCWTSTQGYLSKTAEVITLKYTKTTDLPFSKQLIEDPMLISDPMIYSEEEQVVGSWTDGKPLYQKTVTISSVSYDSSWHEVDHNISDIDTIGSVEGVVIESNGAAYYSANTPRPGYTLGFLVGATKTKIEYINNWLSTASNLIVTLKYTKTIDSPLSGPKKGKIVQRSDIYSEEERLVGRWTDGKPVYQKTWIKVLPSAHDYDSELAYLIDSDVSYIDEMISGNGYLKETTVGAVSILNGGIPNMDGWSYGIHITGTKQLVLYGATRTTYVPGATAVITLQYTKTTDAPFSKQLIEDPQFVMMSDIYSEEEQVVGRWTDGKPIYQKTVIVSSGSLSSGSMNVPTTGITDVEKCIDWSCRLHSNSENRDFPIPYDRITYSESIQCLVHVLSDHTISCTLHSGDRSSYNNIGDICITLKYTKTTDAPGTGPTKGNLIYLPALYSEEEREVGVWTDGRPLYQKTYMNIQLTNSADVTVEAGFGLTKNLIYAQCIGHADNGKYQYPIQSYTIDNDRANPQVRNNDLKMIIADNWSVWTCDLTVQYTKTTDQPGSGTFLTDGTPSHHYSTSEKVVGTWIDGSTVYERTITGFSITLQSGSVRDTGVDISYVSKLISVDALGNDDISVLPVAGYKINNTLQMLGFMNGNVINQAIIQYTKSS